MNFENFCLWMNSAYDELVLTRNRELHMTNDF